MKNEIPATQVALSVVAERDVLAGRRAGQGDYNRLLRQLRSAPDGALVVVDLSGVAVLSSSYFLAALWPLWKGSDAGAKEVFPVLSNAGEEVLEELDFVLERCDGLAWLVAGDAEKLRRPALLGAPDDYDKTIVEQVTKRGAVTATDLHAQDGSIKLTAWSNRLGQLYQRRVLRRAKSGKQMVYSLPWVETNG